MILLPVRLCWSAPESERQQQKISQVFVRVECAMKKIDPDDCSEALSTKLYPQMSSRLQGSASSSLRCTQRGLRHLLGHKASGYLASKLRLIEPAPASVMLRVSFVHARASA